MSTEHQCPQCGGLLPSDAPKGLCPQCLLGAALKPSLEEAGSSVTARESGAEEPTIRRIGPYKLLQTLGEGGCGVVYMAEQREPIRRRVALKVIKLGMDTRQVIARFEAERQALALMDHPNIAKVLDAGTTETGRPYFVMELVKGTRITDYCDQNHLSTAERLKLFTQVCQAIQHAHQKGVIHRDIKPSNILVTLNDGVPVPKVIDFGIAKAIEQPLTEKTVFTAFGQFMGTPAYMSPEQAELSGLDLDTRSDIYALGVLLYELLTGRTPFDPKELVQAGLDEMRRRIREEEPMRPSTRLSTMVLADLTAVAERRQSEPAKLTRFVRGDLDWIVMRCLEKNRNRRYETANGLAMDIRRHLNNEPVVARPPSPAYRFRKLVRRNKLAVAAAVAVLGGLTIGLGLAAWQFVEKSRAYSRAVSAEKHAVESQKRAEAEAARSRAVAEFLGDMLQSVGPSVALGRDTTIVKEILDQTVASLSTNFVHQPEVEAHLREILGRVYLDMGQPDKAEEMFGLGLAVLQRSGHSNTGKFLETTVGLVHALNRQGKLVAAEKVALEALHRSETSSNTNIEWKVRLLNALGWCLLNQHNYPVSEEYYRRALKLLPTEGEDRPHLIELLNNLAVVLQQQGKFAESEPLQRRVLNFMKRDKEDDNLARATDNLAKVLAAQGKSEQAEELMREALRIRRKVLPPAHPDLALGLGNLANVLMDRQKFEEAEGNLREAVDIRKSIAGEPLDLAITLGNLGSCLRDEGKLPQAEAVLREALKVCREKLPARHPQTAMSLSYLASILRQQKKSEGVENLAREALAIREEQMPDSWQTFNSKGILGLVLYEQRKYDEAETNMLAGYEGLKRLFETMPSNAKHLYLNAAQRLVLLYEAKDQEEKRKFYEVRVKDITSQLALPQSGK